MKTALKAVLWPAALFLLLSACGEQQPETLPVDDGRIILADGENTRDFGEFKVHITALTTDILPADVAKGFGIRRSGNRAMLNVVIRRKLDGGITEAAAGTVTAQVKNLTGQLKNISIRKLEEQDAIYYIGEVAVTDGETLFFDVDVSPEGRTDVYKLQYKGQFYSN